MAHNFGQIHEINIPGIVNPEEFNTFNVTVSAPVSFGTPTYIKPAQGRQSLIFSKSELQKSGISIEFGNLQAYNFSLTYHLRNKNLFPQDTDIALPPTTNYQTVYLDSLHPKPNNVRRDKDGNWLASYTLLPSQILDVKVTGQADVSLTPTKQALSDKDRLLYLRERPYWQTSYPGIQVLARQLKTPEAIYTYVVNTLHYDFSRVTDNKSRLGAAKVLEQPNSAVCLEFTDLFIALSRAAGIPAREIDGYAQTENVRLRPLSLEKDILHAWPEYYDKGKGTWIMVDPTWGNTTGGVDYFHTLDFDHLAFVIKGQNSDAPLPAGGYKYAGDENKKDVVVTFGTPKAQPLQQFQLESKLASPYTSGVPIVGAIIVKNVGSGLTDKQTITVTSANLFPPQQNLQVPPIPPFGFVSVPLSFAKTSLLTNRSFTYTILLGQSTITRTIHVSPFVLTASRVIVGGLIIALLTIILCIIAAKSGRLRFPR